VPNELQQCMLLGASYMQRIVYALNVNSQTFYYSMQPNFSALIIIQTNGSDRITNTKSWLKRILLKFQYTKEELSHV